MADNPFQSPIAADDQPETMNSHSIIPAWERMRFFYNVIVGFAGMIVLVVYGLKHPEQWIDSIIGAVIFGVFANVCYLAGPLAEFYLSFFKKRSEVPEVRWPFFILGTGLSLAPIFIILMATVFGP